MKKFGVQTWSIKKYLQDNDGVRESLKRVAEYGYTQLQTAGMSNVDPKFFREVADEYGLEIIGTHYGFAKMQEDPEAAIEYHKIFGAKYIGVGCPPDYARESKEGLLRFIDELNALVDVFAPHGLTITYHNHSFDFKKFDGKVAYDYLIEGFRPEIQFVLDTAWVHITGTDIYDVMDRIDGRIAMLHLKDLQPCYPHVLENGRIATHLPERIEVGEGNMNFPRIIKEAERHGCKYFIVEDEVHSTGDPYDSIRISATNIINKYLEK